MDTHCRLSKQHDSHMKACSSGMNMANTHSFAASCLISPCWYNHDAKNTWRHSMQTTISTLQNTATTCNEDSFSPQIAGGVSLRRVRLELKLPCFALSQLACSLATWEVSVESTHLQLSNMKSLTETLLQDVSSIKERQNMLFQKQDLLHSTLAGEVRVRVSGTPNLLSTSSILAWSPLPNSPPFA